MLPSSLSILGWGRERRIHRTCEHVCLHGPSGKSFLQKGLKAHHELTALHLSESNSNVHPLS